MLYHNLFTDFEAAHQMVRGSMESLQLASIFSTFPSPAISVWQAAFVEIIITSILMGLIMALTDDGNGVPRGALGPLLIGILVAVIGASTAPLTGFAMNPARDFGPKLFAFVAGWGDVALTGGRDNPYFWVPILGPIVGAQLGTALYVKVLAPCVPGNRVVTEEAAKLSNKEEAAA